MKWFRTHTLGKPIIMGRKTFESFGGKALPDRTNIIVTQDKSYATDKAVVCHSIDEAIEASGNVEEVMIIGGMSLYKQTLLNADKLYMTVVDADFEGDAWFPEFDLNDWNEFENHHHKADEKNAYDCDFKILQRKTT